MKNQFDEAWRALVEHDEQLQAPPHLEAAVMTAISGQSVAPAGRPYMFAFGWLAVPATIGAAAVGIIMLGGAPDRVHILNARAHPAARLASAVTMHPPGTSAAATAARRRDSRARGQVSAAVVMMVENTPALLSESLQLVRLRIPKEALLALGLSLVEPDASGTVDVDVLVGEDGLPRNIRQVRVTQEER